MDRVSLAMATALKRRERLASRRMEQLNVLCEMDELSRGGATFLWTSRLIRGIYLDAGV